MEYKNIAFIFKVLGDDTRLKIYEMLKDGEKCACKLLEKFNITQPTLSYHMKMLVESKLINVRKEGTWNHYSINKEMNEKISDFIRKIK